MKKISLLFIAALTLGITGCAEEASDAAPDATAALLTADEGTEASALDEPLLDEVAEMPPVTTCTPWSYAGAGHECTTNLNPHPQGSRVCCKTIYPPYAYPFGVEICQTEYRFGNYFNCCDAGHIPPGGNDPGGCWG